MRENGEEIDGDEEEELEEKFVDHDYTDKNHTKNRLQNFTFVRPS